MTIRSCQTCMRLRWFFGAALPLLGLIWLQPQSAVAFAAHMPQPLTIGLGLTSGALLILAYRLVALQRRLAKSAIGK